MYSLLEEAVQRRAGGDAGPGRRTSTSPTSATSPRSCSAARPSSAGWWPRSTPPSAASPPPATRPRALRARVATLAAMAELEAERYDVALVVGVELMRNVDAQTAAEHLGSAAWAGREATDARFPWPALFSEIADAYAERWGLEYEHLGRIAELNFANAARNPKAQAREWEFERRRLHARTTASTPSSRDGCESRTAVASPTARRRSCLPRRDTPPRTPAAPGASLDDLPAIRGWGHRTAPMLLADKLARERRLPVPVRAPARGDHGRLPAGRHRGARRPRPDRDPRLLHDHRVHGARPLRPDGAGRVLAGGRGGRDRAGRQAARQPERRPDRPRPSRRRDRRADAARRLAPGDATAPGTTRSTARAPPRR